MIIWSTVCLAARRMILTGLQHEERRRRNREGGQEEREVVGKNWAEEGGGIVREQKRLQHEFPLLPYPPSLPNAVSPGGCLQVVLWVEVTVHKQHSVCTDKIESHTTCRRRGRAGRRRAACTSPAARNCLSRASPTCPRAEEEDKRALILLKVL